MAVAAAAAAAADAVADTDAVAATASTAAAVAVASLAPIPRASETFDDASEWDRRSRKDSEGFVRSARCCAVVASAR